MSHATRDPGGCYSPLLTLTGQIQTRKRLSICVGSLFIELFADNDKKEISPRVWVEKAGLIAQCVTGVQPHPDPESNQSDSGPGEAA